MTNNAIVAEELTYRYGQLLAVDHVSFHVAEGEILGFLGPNGAGKTTTVKMLTGQLRPKEGTGAKLDRGGRVWHSAGNAHQGHHRVGCDGQGHRGTPVCPGLPVPLSGPATVDR